MTLPEYAVKFMAIDQVQKFVDDIRKMPYDVDACHGNYVVDAKSLLGILSLSLSREIKLVVHCEEEDFNVAFDLLKLICEDYAV